MADKQITPFQLTDQFTMDNFNQRINETNIALQKMVNPNLLDNPYFGNPVDQRGGYVVPPGTTFYGDSSLSNPLGATPSGLYQTVISKTSTYAHYKGTDGVDYYCAASDAVRGYAGFVYGIDRWKLNGATVTVTVVDGEIQVIDNSTDWNGIIQLFENWKDFAGKTVTLSALGYTVGVGHTLHLQYGDNTSIESKPFPKDTIGLVSFTVKIPDSIDSKFKVRTVRDGSKSGNSTLHLKAIKLELGDQQTLAHQDENGVWVLNEIPDYGEQLARCQRVLIPVLPWVCYSGRIDNDGNAFIEIPTPVSMRSGDVPVIIGAKNGLVYHASGLKDVTYGVASFGANSVTISASGLGITNQVCSGCFANKVFLSKEL